jgi:aspartate aminotransferase
MSYFNGYEHAKPDPIFGLNNILKSDTRPHKIDLLIGYYKNQDNQIPVFKAVSDAKTRLLNSHKDLNYLPIDGLNTFVSKLKTLIFESRFHDSIYGAQTVGGTSAIHHLGKILSLKGKTSVCIPSPTWANHNQIFHYLGSDVRYYPYYDMKTHTLLWEPFIHFLKQQEQGTIILLHSSCHNPSGIDFTFDQWTQIAHICKEKNLFPFFDCAYHGLGDGLDKDVKSINIFANIVDEFFLAYSCSKNFGLYGERTGCLFCFSKNSDTLSVLSSLIKQSIRATYSNPPRQGAFIVSEILSDEQLTMVWKNELISYMDRIHKLRRDYKNLVEQASGKHLSYVTEGKGLFLFTGLDANQVVHLRDNHAIYLASDGRLNLTGLNQNNLNTVVSALTQYL